MGSSTISPSSLMWTAAGLRTASSEPQAAGVLASGPSMASARVHLLLRSSAPALLLASMTLLPFAGKAFTTDDTFFLFSARHALVDPLHPSAFEMTWDRVPQRASQIAPTGPVMAWLLVPAVLAGGSETVAHLVSLAFLLLAILATVSLALRLGSPAGWAAAAGVLLVATPAVLGMAGTAMPDVPAMALGVVGIERLVAWRDEGRVSDGVLAALFLGVAPLARTHLIAALGVGLFFLAGTPAARAAGRPAPRASWVPLLAALLLTVAVTLLTRDPAADAGNIVQTAARLSSVSHLASNSVAFGAHWVLAMAFGVPWAILRWRAILSSPWALLAGSGVAALLLRAAHGGEAPYFIAPSRDSAWPAWPTPSWMPFTGEIASSSPSAPGSSRRSRRWSTGTIPRSTSSPRLQRR